MSLTLALQINRANNSIASFHFGASQFCRLALLTTGEARAFKALKSLSRSRVRLSAMMHADQLFSACAKTPPLETRRTSTTIACTQDIRYRTILYYLEGFLLAKSISCCLHQFSLPANQVWCLPIFHKNFLYYYVISFKRIFNKLKCTPEESAQLQQVNYSTL